MHGTRSGGLISTSDYKQWITPEGLHNTVISTDTLSSEELVRFCDHARREFYLRPSYLIYKSKANAHVSQRNKKDLQVSKDIFQVSY